MSGEEGKGMGEGGRKEGPGPTGCVRWAFLHPAKVLISNVIVSGFKLQMKSATERATPPGRKPAHRNHVI